jgi:hypothetical protein
MRRSSTDDLDVSPSERWIGLSFALTAFVLAANVCSGIATLAPMP